MPLLWFSLAFTLGIAATPHFSIPTSLIWIGLIISSTVSVFEWRCFRDQHHSFISNKLFRIPLALLFFAFILGLGRFQMALPNHQFLDSLGVDEPQEVIVDGLVVSDPVRANRYTSFIMSANEIADESSSKSLHQKLYVTLPPSFRVYYGDQVQLTGQLERSFPRDTVPIHSARGRDGIFLKMDNPNVDVLAVNQGNPILSSLYRARGKAHELIFDMVPPSESGVLSGILLGIGSSIPTQLWNGYRASGIAHILVISGFNVSIISVLLFRILERRVPMERAIIITISLTIMYTLLVGADTPVVRAAVMATIGLPAAYVGRKTMGFHNLAIAAAIMLLQNPFQLWDLSFQLSFIATLSLLVMADPVSAWVNSLIFGSPESESEVRKSPLIELVVTTLCASFSVFPLIFRITGTLSLSSIPANILVAPVQPLIMAFGGAGILIGLISPVLGGLVAKIAWPFIAYCNQIALRFSALPAATIFLPEWVSFSSLLLVIGTLIYFAFRQIVGLTKPYGRVANKAD